MSIKSAQGVKDWRKRTKLRIIKAMGDKCQLCSYDGCPEAFDLHHLDPSEKEISLSSIRANPKAWATIVKELRKCVLLCATCHREVEAHWVEIKVKQYFNESYANADFFERELGKYKPKLCIICSEEYIPSSSTQKYCSPLCK